MLILSGSLPKNALAGMVAVVTGAGRGIGFEAARSLACLGAGVVVAEIDGQSGAAAAAAICAEAGMGRALAVQTDVGSEAAVQRLKEQAEAAFGAVDIVVNNAAVTPMGAVPDRPIADWDASYRVNLRGPVLLARAFLPGMIARNRGVFACVSSVGQAYMGAYECFKAAQVHLAATLDAELEESAVCAFAIGPGLVRTPGALAGITELAPLYGKSVEEFFELARDHIITPEQAGAGFAAAIALAPQFRGQEISSTQALIAAGIPMTTNGAPALPGEAEGGSDLSAARRAAAADLCRQVRATLAEQSAGWARRNLFERQWVVRDFRKNAGMPVDEWLTALDRLEQALAPDGATPALPPLERLAGYYHHLARLAEGYEKDPVKLANQLAAVRGWEDEVRRLAALLQA